jgi:hypothetical protein
MAIVSAADARSSLLRKGFKEREGRKHTFYDFFVDGKEVGINTHFSRGSKAPDIDSSMMHLMAPQLQFQKSRQVLELLNCTMTEAEYVRYLKANGKLNPPRPL